MVKKITFLTLNLSYGNMSKQIPFPADQKKSMNHNYKHLSLSHWFFFLLLFKFRFNTVMENTSPTPQYQAYPVLIRFIVLILKVPLWSKYAGLVQHCSDKKSCLASQQTQNNPNKEANIISISPPKRRQESKLKIGRRVDFTTCLC